MIAVYSLYSTESRVMEQKPSGVGDVPGFGMSVVIPFFHSDGQRFEL